MRVRRSAAIAALAASGAYAQMTSQSTSYMTVTYSDCPSESMDSMITVTNGITVTYCPECEMAATTQPPTPGHTTVYTTTYLSLCPTGVVPATYTVTESCTEPTPTWTPGPSHIPQGFTVTVKECSVCGESTKAVTVTEPCGCDANEGTPVPQPNPMPTGSSPGGSNSVPGSPPATTTPASGSPGSSCNGDACGGSGNQSPGGSSPGGSSPGSSSPGGSSPSGSTGSSNPGSSCNGGDCGGQASTGNTSPAPKPAAPYPTTTTTQCPGPQCRAAASSHPTGVNNGNTSSNTPDVSRGAATSPSAGLLSSTIAAVLIAALAFML